MKPLEELTDEELNNLVAERVMKWEECRSPIQPMGDSKSRNWDCGKGSGWDSISKNLWKPSTSFKNAYEMETEIERQGKHKDYGLALIKVLELEIDDELDLSGTLVIGAFEIAHATARQRTLAALKTFGVEGK